MCVCVVCVLCVEGARALVLHAMPVHSAHVLFHVGKGVVSVSSLLLSCACMGVWAGRDFVARLLAKNPKERINAKDALEHPWM